MLWKTALYTNQNHSSWLPISITAERNSVSAPFKTPCGTITRKEIKFAVRNKKSRIFQEKCCNVSVNYTRTLREIKTKQWNKRMALHSEVWSCCCIKGQRKNWKSKTSATQTPKVTNKLINFCGGLLSSNIVTGTLEHVHPFPQPPPSFFE